MEHRRPAMLVRNFDSMIGAIGTRAIVALLLFIVLTLVVAVGDFPGARPAIRSQ